MALFQNKKKEPEKQLTFSENVLMYLHDVVYMLVALMILLTLFFRVVVVSGPSMKQTLLDGDYLLLTGNLFYREPQYGDVVVVCKESFDHGKPIVKRVVATEGQTVDIDFEQGIVYVNGQPLEEKYTNTPTNMEEGMAFPLRVDMGCVFVMGDNRNNSRDSRYPEIGQVDRREILGKVNLLMYPGTDFGSQPRDFGRIGLVK